jgi:hypothetical protein
MIPAFNKEHTRCYVSPQFTKELDIKYKGASYYVSNLFQSTTINLNIPTELNKNSFNVNPDKDSIIITKSFIIAIINLDILSEFNIPIVSVSLVSERDFINQ